MSVFPLALLNFGYAERTVWGFCSGVAGTMWLCAIVFILRNMTVLDCLRIGVCSTAVARERDYDSSTTFRRKSLDIADAPIVPSRA